jgi:ornithine cyclodeaminase/alanine dehydrogenase-like protein (mu-crystallin family)
MAPLLLLNADDVRSLIDLPTLFDALGSALRDLSAGTTSVPPRTVARAPGGFLGSMPGYLPGTALEAKLVAVFPANHERGLPSHQALIALFDEETGAPLCVMDGTVITAARTGATAAVAARALARPDARTLAILGAGVQGRSHLDAFPYMFELEEIRVASRDRRHAEALAELDPRARAVGSFEEAVRGADLVCCCTDADEPVLLRDWLEPGTHVSSVGVGREVDAATVRAASIFVEWRGAAENPPPTGSAELQGLDPSTIAEIGEVLAGANPGRRSADELTLYKSTGHAVEDAAAARLVFDRASAEGVGGTFEL